MLESCWKTLAKMNMPRNLKLVSAIFYISPKESFKENYGNFSYVIWNALMVLDTNIFVIFILLANILRPKLYKFPIIIFEIRR